MSSEYFEKVWKFTHAKPGTVVPSFSADFAYEKSVDRPSVDVDTAEEKPSDLFSIVDKYDSKSDEWSRIVRDVFSSVYDPRGSKPVPVDKHPRLAGAVTPVLESNPHWPTIVKAGRVNRDLAAAGTVDVMKAVAEVLELDKVKPPEPPGDMPGQSDEDKAKRRKRYEKMVEAYEESIVDRLKNAMENGELDGVLKGAADKSDEREKNADALRSCGLSPDTSTGFDPVDASLCDALGSDSRLREIVDLIGRMERASEDFVQVTHGTGKESVTDVHNGDDVTDMPGDEYAMMALAPEAWAARYANGQVSVYDREGPENKKHGPVMVLVDKSGSMYGERIRWARAVGAAAALKAVGQGRLTSVTMFGGTGEHTTVMASDKTQTAEMIRTLGMSAGGGTDTEDAVVHALSFMKSSGKKFEQSDMLLVTDGEWPDLSDSCVAAMNEAGVRLYVVMLEGGCNVKGAEKVWTINNLNMDTAAEIITAVNS